MDGLSPLVDVKINGRPTRMIVDSGAVFSILSSDDAEKFDLKKIPLRWANIQGVGGKTRGRIQTAHEFNVSGRTLPDFDLVLEPVRFRHGVSGLLGQDVLNAGDTDYDLANGLIRLLDSDDCQDAAAIPWADGRAYSVIPFFLAPGDKPKILGQVSVNGVKVTAQFDTGAPYSMLSLKAAARAGIGKDDPRLRPGGVSSGAGPRLAQTWIAPVDSFRIGDEQIRQTGLRVSEMDIPDAEMLIGADFFLSHRVLVSNSQHRLYLSYNGGPVFDLGSGSDAKAVTAAGMGDSGRDPVDADGFDRRAEAFAARRDYPRAFADFDRALALAPKDPRILYARSQVYAAQKKPGLALADLDEALRQEPADVDMLISRGGLNLHERRIGPAKADFDAVLAQEPELRPSIAAAYADAAYYPQALAEYDTWLSGVRTYEDKAAGLDGKCRVRAEWNHQLDEALEDCNEAIHLEPHRGDHIFSRGVLYLRMGRYGDAIRDLNRTIEFQPRLAFAIYLRGLARLGEGKAAESQADLAAATAIDSKIGEWAARLGLTPEPAAKP
jgi:tetratricopeptide (TPR) repeat protein